jgi:hypothetical protein
MSEVFVRSTATSAFLATILFSTSVFSASLPDYGKRAAPIDPAIRKELLGRWTNPLDKLIIEITDVDLISGKIAGTMSPTTGPAAADGHELTGWVSAAPENKNADHVVPVSFTSTLYEYGTLPSWTGYLKDAQLVTLSLLSWPNKPYAWDHMTVFQVTWTKLPA